MVSLLFAIILLLMAAVAIPVGRRLTGDYFSPAALFVSAWCGTFGLFQLRMLPYPPLHPGTRGLIIGTIALVTAGALVGMRMRLTRTGEGDCLSDIEASRWVIGYACLGLIGTLWYVTVVTRGLGWAALQAPGAIRGAFTEYRLPSTYLFLEFFCIVTPLLAASLQWTGSRLNKLAIAGAGACALATWVTTDRTQFFTVALGVFFMYAFRHGRDLSWKNLIVAGLVLCSALTANFLFVGALTGKTPANLGVTMQLPTGYDGAMPPVRVGQGSSIRPGPRLPAGGVLGRIERLLTRGSTLYLYATGSYAALNVLVQMSPPLTMGLHSAYPVFRALQRIGVVRVSLPKQIPDFVPLGLEGDTEIYFNGFTFLFYPMMDFGAVGALAYAALVGIFAGIVYRLATTRRNSPLGLLLMAHLSIALILSVFVNKFNNTASWYIAVATLVPILLHTRRWVRRSSAGQYSR